MSNGPGRWRTVPSLALLVSSGQGRPACSLGFGKVGTCGLSCSMCGPWLCAAGYGLSAVRLARSYVEEPRHSVPLLQHHH